MGTKLNNSKLCVNEVNEVACEEIYPATEDRCPSCGSTISIPMSRCITTMREYERMKGEQPCEDKERPFDA